MGSDEPHSSGSQRRANFNPRSPCGERLPLGTIIDTAGSISIHAPRAGSDVTYAVAGYPAGIFQSTLPVRGATQANRAKFSRLRISIHAPRAGSDVYALNYNFISNNFNPRSPCGERRVILTVNGNCVWKFQSTLPVRGATSGIGVTAGVTPIFQSTLPVRGATYVAFNLALSPVNFNPRSPCGERLISARRFCAILTISIHAPRAGSDTNA